MLAVEPVGSIRADDLIKGSDLTANHADIKL